MNRVASLGVLILIIVVFSACTNTNKPSPVTDWDLRAIGYYEGWDESLRDEGYKIGIVDIASRAVSDDGNTEVQHADLLEAVVKRITSICEVELIELSEENNTPDELMRAIGTLIENGNNVINISLGTSDAFEFSTELNEKIIEDNIFVVCSAGNNPVGLMYPARCKNTYSVLSCDIYRKTNKNLAGEEKCSYTMPGLHINLLDDFFSGTSLSSVYFSVICSAYCAAHPEAEPEAIISDIQNSCTSGNENSYGIVQINYLFKS